MNDLSGNKRERERDEDLLTESLLPPPKTHTTVAESPSKKHRSQKEIDSIPFKSVTGKDWEVARRLGITYAYPNNVKFQPNLVTIEWVEGMDAVGPDGNLVQWYYPFTYKKHPHHCQICVSNKDEDKLLLCDFCDQAYHMYCLDPPVTEVPGEDMKWYCQNCPPDVPIPLKARYAPNTLPRYDGDSDFDSDDEDLALENEFVKILEQQYDERQKGQKKKSGKSSGRPVEQPKKSVDVEAIIRSQIAEFAAKPNVQANSFVSNKSSSSSNGSVEQPNKSKTQSQSQSMNNVTPPPTAQSTTTSVVPPPPPSGMYGAPPPPPMYGGVPPTQPGMMQPPPMYGMATTPGVLTKPPAGFQQSGFVVNPPNMSMQSMHNPQIVNPPQQQPKKRKKKLKNPTNKPRTPSTTTTTTTSTQRRPQSSSSSSSSSSMQVESLANPRSLLSTLSPTKSPMSLLKEEDDDDEKRYNMRKTRKQVQRLIHLTTKQAEQLEYEWTLADEFIPSEMEVDASGRPVSPNWGSLLSEYATTALATSSDPCPLCTTSEVQQGALQYRCQSCLIDFHINCLDFQFIKKSKKRNQPWFCPRCRCASCFKRNNLDKTLTCNKCLQLYHTNCLVPNARLEQGKRLGQWRCQACRCFVCKEETGNLIPCQGCRTSFHLNCMKSIKGMTNSTIKEIKKNPSLFVCPQCTCARCGKGSPANEQNMVLCSGCELFFHIDCQQSFKNQSKNGKFYCDGCVCNICQEFELSRKKRRELQETMDGEIPVHDLVACKQCHLTFHSSCVQEMAHPRAIIDSDTGFLCHVCSNPEGDTCNFCGCEDNHVVSSGKFSDLQRLMHVDNADQTPPRFLKCSNRLCINRFHSVCAAAVEGLFEFQPTGGSDTRLDHLPKDNVHFCKSCVEKEVSLTDDSLELVQGYEIPLWLLQRASQQMEQSKVNTTLISIMEAYLHRHEDDVEQCERHEAQVKEGDGLTTTERYLRDHGFSAFSSVRPNQNMVLDNGSFNRSHKPLEVSILHKHSQNVVWNGPMFADKMFLGGMNAFTFSKSRLDHLHFPSQLSLVSATLQVPTPSTDDTIVLFSPDNQSKLRYQYLITQLDSCNQVLVTHLTDNQDRDHVMYVCPNSMLPDEIVEATPHSESFLKFWRIHKNQGKRTHNNYLWAVVLPLPKQSRIRHRNASTNLLDMIVGASHSSSSSSEKGLTFSTNQPLQWRFAQKMEFLKGLSFTSTGFEHDAMGSDDIARAVNAGASFVPLEKVDGFNVDVVIVSETLTDSELWQWPALNKCLTNPSIKIVNGSNYVKKCLETRSILPVDRADELYPAAGVIMAIPDCLKHGQDLVDILGSSKVGPWTLIISQDVLAQLPQQDRDLYETLAEPENESSFRVNLVDRYPDKADLLDATSFFCQKHKNECRLAITLVPALNDDDVALGFENNIHVVNKESLQQLIDQQEQETEFFESKKRMRQQRVLLKRMRFED